MSLSAALMALELKAPARPRSLVRSRTAARVGFSASVVSGCLVFDPVATAVTARVSSVAYGVEAATLRCALTTREAAIISIAFVIFLVAETDRMRRL